jgi:hypothetical protein
VIIEFGHAADAVGSRRLKDCRQRASDVALDNGEKVRRPPTPAPTFKHENMASVAVFEDGARMAVRSSSINGIARIRRDVDIPSQDGAPSALSGWLQNAILSFASAKSVFVSSA